MGLEAVGVILLNLGLSEGGAKNADIVDEAVEIANTSASVISNLKATSRVSKDYSIINPL